MAVTISERFPLLSSHSRYLMAQTSAPYLEHPTKGACRQRLKSLVSQTLTKMVRRNYSLPRIWAEMLMMTFWLFLRSANGISKIKVLPVFRLRGEPGGLLV